MVGNEAICRGVYSSQISQDFDLVELDLSTFDGPQIFC